MITMPLLGTTVAAAGVVGSTTGRAEETLVGEVLATGALGACVWGDEALRKGNGDESGNCGMIISGIFESAKEG
jgi:hypothetical protein